MNRNIFATILLVLSIGIVLTVTMDLKAKADQQQTINDQYAAAIAKSAQLLQLRKSLTAQYMAVSDADKEALDKMLPNSLDNIRLIIDMNGIAYARHMILKGISASGGSTGSNAAPTTAPTAPGPGRVVSPGGLNTAASMSSSAPTLQTVTVSFGVSATYDQFIALMQDLEKNLRLMDLTHLSLSANNTGTYDWSVEFQTYWLKQ